VFYKISYSNDLNDLIQILATDESNTFANRKLSVNGTESYSFTDIDNLIRQTYSTKKEHKEAMGLVHKLASHWQLFFHGNTHITNIDHMLRFYQNKNPQFTGYENALKEVNLQPTSFREYYTNKAEKYKQQNDLLGKEREDDLRFPRVQRYWDISLD
jgi:hypothetical protein